MVNIRDKMRKIFSLKPKFTKKKTNLILRIKKRYTKESKQKSLHPCLDLLTKVLHEIISTA